MEDRETHERSLCAGAMTAGALFVIGGWWSVAAVAVLGLVALSVWLHRRSGFYARHYP